MSVSDLVLTPTGLRFCTRTFPCSIGRNGITREKREGDGATPAGTHRIAGMLYRPDRIAARLLPGWATPIGPRDLWCDAPDHAAYNQRTRAPFAASAEHLRRPDPLYDLILVTSWNFPDAVPHRGSAIFLHQWRRPGYPTAGCIALDRAHLLWVAQHVVPGARLIVRA